jgi:hypothetical protein
MPPAKYSTIDAGGVNFQLSQTELKQIKTLVDEMKKLKTLYEAQMKVQDKMRKVQKEIVSGDKLETQYQRDRLKTLQNIYNRMKAINQESLETLKRENPHIPRTAPMGGASAGRYNYSPADAEAVANAKKQEANYGQKLISIYDRLKKSYAYQLFYFSAASVLVAGMLSNSKVWSHFMDIIGSALGFIMDMLLVSIIPWVVQLVNFLFMVGEAISKLPDWFKQVVVLIGLFVAGLMAIKVYTAISETLAAIKAIGAAAGVAKGAEGVGGLAEAMKGLPLLTTLTISVKVLGMEALGYLASFVSTKLPIMAAELGPIVGAYMATQTPSYQAEYKKNTGMDYNTPYSEWAPQQQEAANKKNYDPWSRGDTAASPIINVSIAGEAISQAFLTVSRYQQQVNNFFGGGTQ